MFDNRFRIKFAGESGQGINSLGEIAANTLKKAGYYTFGYREYPSLIKGGVASYQIGISNVLVHSTTQKCDVLIAISRASLREYLSTVAFGGEIIHSVPNYVLDKHEKAYLEVNNIEMTFINAEEESILVGGLKIMANVYILGFIWSKLSMDLGMLEGEVLERFGKDLKKSELNSTVLEKGYLDGSKSSKYKLPEKGNCNPQSVIISGNDMLSLGAVTAGCRALYAYPMTPASSILTSLAEWSVDNGMLVRQVEDEISAVQMALGSMYTGTRALTVTSGGGFDLMTETISMSGMTEIPLVVVLAQRPGPATGLPTWSSAADLNLAVYSSHGEFPRCVLAISSAESAFTLIQFAFNIAERYQIPVTVLTEKHIAESLYTVEKLPAEIKIERGLAEKITDFRYSLADDGISPRWLPGAEEKTYITNSDEHAFDGSSTENAEVAKSMMDKRMSKMVKLMENSLPPVLYGPDKAEITVIGWGSTYGVALDLIIYHNKLDSYKINYIHFEQLFPLNESEIKKILKGCEVIVSVESNKTGQFTSMLNSFLTKKIKHLYTKYDGRPIFPGDLYAYLNSIRINSEL